MVGLLFNPNGRIARNRFWQGMVVLTVATVIVVAAYSTFNPALWYAHALLIFPYICVHGKRLHDAGFTAWLVLVIWLGVVIVGMIVQAVLSPFFTTPEILQMQEEIWERVMSGDVEGSMEGTRIIAKKLMPVSILAAVISNILAAIGIGLLPSQSRENKHGPVPGTHTADTFQ